MSSTSISKQLIIATSVLTFLIMEGIFFVYYSFRYTPTLHNLMLVTVMIEGGGILGALATWLFFPKTYTPHTWWDTYPQPHWACLLLVMPFLLTQFNLLPEDFVPLWIKHELFLFLGCPLFTYFLFYTVLAFRIKQQGLNSTSLLTE